MKSRGLKANLKNLSRESMLESVRMEVAKICNVQSARFRREHPNTTAFDIPDPRIIRIEVMIRRGLL
jgi:hypothetical protein